MVTWDEQYNITINVKQVQPPHPPIEEKTGLGTLAIIVLALYALSKKR